MTWLNLAILCDTVSFFSYLTLLIGFTASYLLIFRYYRVNDVKRFTNSRPLRPGSEDFAVSGIWPGLQNALNINILNLCLFTPYLKVCSQSSV